MAEHPEQKHALPPILQLLRPAQWVKNGFVCAPLLFALEFSRAEAWQATLIAVLSFVCASGAVYAFNDVKDIDADRQHPIKKFRPLPSGKITLKTAWMVICVMLAASIFLASLLPVECMAVLLPYIALNIAYSLWLKHVALVDALCIAAGFVLRVLMGGYAIPVAISPWIILATFLLALFLAFGKRYHELRIMGAGKGRQSLSGYRAGLLDRLISISCGATLMCYALYTIETARNHGQGALVYTVAFVAFGLFRYLQVLYVQGGGGEPERVLFRDKLFLANAVAWLVVTLCILGA